MKRAPRLDPGQVILSPIIAPRPRRSRQPICAGFTECHTSCSACLAPIREAVAVIPDPDEEHDLDQLAFFNFCRDCARRIGQAAESHHFEVGAADAAAEE